MTGVMSRHVVTIGAIFLIVCGLVPKVGAVIATVPIEVLGGGVIVMFGMVVAAGVSMLSDVDWNRRNMVIFAIALSMGLGLQLEPGALQHLPDTLRILATSGILPAALIAIVLNLVCPRSWRRGDRGGLGRHGTDAEDQISLHRHRHRSAWSAWQPNGVAAVEGCSRSQRTFTAGAANDGPVP
jgi:hypothetical protein